MPARFTHVEKSAHLGNIPAQRPLPRAELSRLHALRHCGVRVAPLSDVSTYSRVLCPVDGSEFSIRALRFASAFARRVDAALAVVTVSPHLTSLEPWASPPGRVPDVRDAQGELAAAVGRFVRDSTGRDDIEVRVESGSVVQEILRVAADWPADLLVMGTHGTSGFDRLVLGSITEKVLRRTSVPVLTIPRFVSGSPALTIESVLCAIDRSEAAGAATTHALGIARDFAARVTPVHVVEHVLDEDPQFSQHFDLEACYRTLEPQLQEWYGARLPPANGHRLEPMQVRFGKANRELLVAAEQVQADLLVIGTAGTPAMFGSTTDHLVRMADVPVLVVPPPPEPHGD